MGYRILFFLCTFLFSNQILCSPDEVDKKKLTSAIIYADKQKKQNIAIEFIDEEQKIIKTIDIKAQLKKLPEPNEIQDFLKQHVDRKQTDLSNLCVVLLKRPNKQKPFLYWFNHGWWYKTYYTETKAAGSE